MINAVKSGRSGAAAMHQMIKNRPSPAEAQWEKICSYPCTLVWSDGATNPSTMGTVFDNEENYKKYKRYKDSGKPYPVKIEVLEPAEEELHAQSALFRDGTRTGDYEFISRMCDMFTAALQQYLEILPTHQIEEATRVMEQQAAEATAAMVATLPDLEGADL